MLMRNASGILEQARSRCRYKHERAWRKQAQKNRQQQRSKGKKGRGRSGKQELQRPRDMIEAKLYTSFMYKAGSWPEAQRSNAEVLTRLSENLPTLQDLLGA